MTLRAIVLGVLAASVLVGCADNSFLELELCVPAAGAFADTKRVTIAPRSVAPVRP